jgi:hypothetical protein
MITVKPKKNQKNTKKDVIDFVTSPIFWAGVCLVIVFIIVIVVVAVFNKSPSDPGSGDDPNVGPITQPCPLDPNKKVLVACDPKDVSSCSSCSNGFYSCYTVDKENPYQFTAPNSTDLINIPDGTWCLPTKTTTLTCNQATGVPILSQLNANENQWICSCKYPKLFSNPLGGDCLYETACSRLNADSPNHLVCPTGGDFCEPGSTFLENPTWNPLIGVCDCPQGTKYLNLEDGQSKVCVADTCSPGTSKSDGSCDCDKISDIKTDKAPYNTFISCPSQTKDGTCLTGSQCIQDPCNPGGKTGPDKKCVCDSSNYVPIDDSDSPTGSSCFSLCYRNGPCGDRGTCYIDKDAKSGLQALCKDCKYPWTQGTSDTTADTGLCQFLKKSEGQSCNSDKECLSKDCQLQYLFWGDKKCFSS